VALAGGSRGDGGAVGQIPGNEPERVEMKEQRGCERAQLLLRAIEIDNRLGTRKGCI